MKKLIIFSLLLAVVSCESLKEEFQPVFTGKYPQPKEYEYVTMQTTHSIAELVAMYTPGKPIDIKDDIIIGGKISTTDQPGNFYKSFYIQDGTGGIEIKIGRNSLYNDYLPGQTVYIKCKGLTLGMYGLKNGNGMVQIGFKDPSLKYETAYLENPMLVEEHIIRGPLGDKVQPVVITQDNLPTSSQTQATNKYIGQLITLKGLTYGWYDAQYKKTSQVFMYLDSNKDKSEPHNRLFISEGDTKVTTWSLSKERMTMQLLRGDWDTFQIGSGNSKYEKVIEHKGNGTYPTIEKNAYAVSHYFSTPNGTAIQIRTSGYAKFADTEVDPAILNGSKTLSVTGILTLYEGKIQISVNDITDLVVE